MPSIVSLRMLRPAVVIRYSLFMIVALLNAAGVNAEPRELETALRNELQNKVLILRGWFYADAKLRFDANGNPLGKVQPGYWSSDGMLQATRISVDGHGVLHVHGNRIINEYDRQAGTFRNIISKRSVEIQLELEPSWHDAEQVNPLLDKVFLRDPKALAHLVPDYWEWCFAGTRHQLADGSWECRDPNNLKKPERATSPLPDTGQAGEPTGMPTAGAQDSAPAADKTTVAGDAAMSSPPAQGGLPSPQQSTALAPGIRAPDWSSVARVGGPVKPPRPMLAPDPVYTEIAKASGLQGVSILWVVVDELGMPVRIRIQRPLGAGLDDKAVEAVRQWRFTPASAHGRPIAVQINVEINFRLY
jgi:TonB family protein